MHDFVQRLFVADIIRPNADAIRPNKIAEKPVFLKFSKVSGHH
jgi:hypothetical protein